MKLSKEHLCKKCGGSYKVKSIASADFSPAYLVFYVICPNGHEDTIKGFEDDLREAGTTEL